MTLGETFTAILPTRARDRSRFKPADEAELSNQCANRKAHREAERAIK